MLLQDSSLSIGRTLPLTAGTTIGDVAADLAYLMGRHQSLRSLLEFGPGGEPRQVRHRSGTMPLAVVDAGDADPALVADELCREYVDTNFDYAAEWPLRWAVVLRHGEPAWLVSVTCHLAADGHGLNAMWSDLARWRGGAETGGSPAAGVSSAGVSPALPPMEQYRRQASPAGQRLNAAALRYWERLLRVIPARRLAPSPDPRQPPYWQYCYESPASHLAVQAIARRTGATTSTVLLAAYAVAMARMTGSSPAVIQVTASNRFRPGFGDSVSTIMQASLCVIDVAGVTFDEAVGRAWRAAVNAYKYAYCDPRARAELIQRVGAERGEELDVSVGVNDRRIMNRAEPEGSAGPADPPAAPAELRAALTRSRLTPGFRRERPAGRCFLLINDVPDMVFYEFLADTRYVSPAQMEACLRGMEQVTVASALDPAAMTGVPPPGEAAPGAAASGERASA
jgi:hypothetical protein